VGYAEKVEEAYDEYRDVDRDFEEFIASTDRLRDFDKFPLLVSLKLLGLVGLAALSEP